MTSVANWRMHSWPLYICPSLKPFTSWEAMCQLCSSMASTLWNWCWFPSCPTLLMTSNQGCGHWQLLTQWLTGVYGAFIGQCIVQYFPTSTYFWLTWDVEGPTESIFLPFMTHLCVFEIHIDPSSATISDFDILSFLMHSLRVSLTSLTTLEHLKFNIIFESGSNYFNCYSLFDDLCNTEVWRHLNSIITHPMGLQLQIVDINIKYSFC